MIPMFLSLDINHIRTGKTTGSGKILLDMGHNILFILL